MPPTQTLFETAQPEIAFSGVVWSPQHQIDVVTCEYPPAVGGVADYTLKMVEKLEQTGCATRVWTAGLEDNGKASFTGIVKRSFVDFGLRDIFVHDRLMGTAKDRCLLLQWEPVGFGLQSLNLP